MGMTIEDAILCLKGIKQYGSDTFTKRSQGDWQNSLNLAIDTMCKYQKIIQILQEQCIIPEGCYPKLKKIKEVVEDVFYGDKTKNVRGNRATELLEHISALFTKEDVIAMLTELQAEILEMKSYESPDGQDLVMLADIGILFQEKINSLKEGTDGKEDS